MKVIDLESWNRREIYEMFSSLEWPFYAVTIPLDVTKVKEVSKRKNLSFYYLMIWLCTKAINSVEEFRIRIQDGKLVIVDTTSPSYTDSRKEEENFHITTLPWEADVISFDRTAKEQNQNQNGFLDKNSKTDDLIYFSCLPWFDFTNLTNEHSLDKDDFIPRIAWGKYYSENGRLMIHLSIEVNHRIIDGKHLGMFKAALEKAIEELSVTF